MIRHFSPAALLVLSVLSLACTPTKAAAQTAENIARFSAALDQAIADSRTKADALLDKDAVALALPVSDHLSTLQYCALLARVSSASNEAAVADLRTKAAVRRAADPPAKATVQSVPFADLFPLVRDDLSFDREPSTAEAGRPGRTFMASDVGVCTVLSLGDPTAQARATEWLESSASGWRRKGKSRGWRIYQVKDPSLSERDLVLLEAPLSKDALALGVTAAHLVGVTGLP